VPEAAWNPEGYLSYAGPRRRPAMDLLARIPLEEANLIYDLGCGPGTVTAALAERWPTAKVVGIDHSPEMLTHARENFPNLVWEERDLANWTPTSPPELIYSNAALHWLSHHEVLFPRLIEQLAPGGVLAVQMPLNWPQPTHRIAREILADGGGSGSSLGTAELRDRLSKPPVLPTESYYDLLAPRCASLDLWTATFYHALEGDDPVLEWARTTSLRPILGDLDAGEAERFLENYRRRVRGAYPRRPDGRTLLPYNRLFLVARASTQGSKPR